jgi:hypothetical protein
MNWSLNGGFMTPDEVQNEIDDFSKERENTLKGRSSLHDFFGRSVMEFEQAPAIRTINYMNKVKRSVERGKTR